MSLVAPFADLVHYIGLGMTLPTLQSFLTLVTGWLFAPRRTVTAMLVAAGAVGSKHHSAFHRLFAAARWSLDVLGLHVFDLVAPWRGDDVVELSVDDTLARKRGSKVFGAGMHHDSMRSSRQQAVLTWGHSWVVLSVIVRLPFCPHRVFSLPILFRLYLNHKASEKWRLAYRTRPELAVQMLHTLCHRYLSQRFHLVADSAYGGQTVLGVLPLNCEMTSRMPLKARLCEPPPERRPGTNGRPRKRGARLPSPEQMLERRGRRVSLDLYGRHDPVRLVDARVRWHHVPGRPLKVVVVEPLRGGRPVQAFYTTCQECTAEQVLTRYAHRWSIEEAFQGSKTHLGFEQPQGWKRRAVERTAPIAMLLYSLIIVWFARDGHRAYHCSPPRWYRTKATPSFADMLASLKRECIEAEVSKHLGEHRLPQNLLNALFAAAHCPP